MLGSWYPEFVHVYVFMRIHEILNNNQENLNHYIFLNFILLTARTYHTKAFNLRLVLESFEAHVCPHLSLTLVV